MSKQVQQQQILQQALIQTATQIEKQLDKEIDRLTNPDEDDLEQIRRQRLAQLKQQQQERQQWASLGHGKMNSINDDKEFFECCKHSKRVVALFTTPTNQYCKLMEEHLSKLAQKHIETKFVTVNAEKAPFLVDKLKIWMMPTVVLIKEQKTEHSIVGLDELKRGEFTNRDLQLLLAKYDVIFDK